MLLFIITLECASYSNELYLTLEKDLAYLELLQFLDISNIDDLWYFLLEYSSIEDLIVLCGESIWRFVHFKYLKQYYCKQYWSANSVPGGRVRKSKKQGLRNTQIRTFLLLKQAKSKT